MRVRETRVQHGGFGHPRIAVERVRDLQEDEATPEGAVVVPDDTPLSDWTLQAEESD